MWIKESSSASGAAGYPTGGSGSASADDGLGDPEVLKTDTVYTIWKDSAGPGYKLLTATNGVATVKVSLSAAGSATGPGASAVAYTAYLPEVFNRSVVAWPYGYTLTYGKQQLDGPDSIVTYPWGSYSRAIMVPNDPYNIGPTTVSQYVDFELAGGYIVPGLENLNVVHMNFGGGASPIILDDNLASHYMWTYNKGHNNDGHGIPYYDGLSQYHWDIPDVGTDYVKYLVNPSDLTINKGDAGIIDMTKLQYTWSDGVSITYNLAMTPHSRLRITRNMD